MDGLEPTISTPPQCYASQKPCYIEASRRRRRGTESPSMNQNDLDIYNLLDISDCETNRSAFQSMQRIERSSTVQEGFNSIWSFGLDLNFKNSTSRLVAYAPAVHSKAPVFATAIFSLVLLFIALGIRPPVWQRRDLWPVVLGLSTVAVSLPSRAVKELEQVVTPSTRKLRTESRGREKDMNASSPNVSNTGTSQSMPSIRPSQLEDAATDNQRLSCEVGIGSEPNMARQRISAFGFIWSLLDKSLVSDTLVMLVCELIQSALQYYWRPEYRSYNPRIWVSQHAEVPFYSTRSIETVRSIPAFAESSPTCSAPTFAQIWKHAIRTVVFVCILVAVLRILLVKNSGSPSSWLSCIGKLLDCIYAVSSYGRNGYGRGASITDLLYGKASGNTTPTYASSSESALPNACQISATAHDTDKIYKKGLFSQSIPITFRSLEEGHGRNDTRKTAPKDEWPVTTQTPGTSQASNSESESDQFGSFSSMSSFSRQHSPGDSTSERDSSQSGSRSSSSKRKCTSCNRNAPFTGRPNDDDDDTEDVRRKEPRRSEGHASDDNATDSAFPCIFHVGEPEIYQQHKTRYKYISQLVRHLRSHSMFVCHKCLTNFATSSAKENHPCAKACANASCRRHCDPLFRSPEPCDCILSPEEQWRRIFLLQYGNVLGVGAEHAGPSVEQDTHASQDEERHLAAPEGTALNLAPPPSEGLEEWFEQFCNLPADFDAAAAGSLVHPDNEATSSTQNLEVTPADRPNVLGPGDFPSLHLLGPNTESARDSSTSSRSSEREEELTILVNMLLKALRRSGSDEYEEMNMVARKIVPASSGSSMR